MGLRVGVVTYNDIGRKELAIKNDAIMYTTQEDIVNDGIWFETLLLYIYPHAGAIGWVCTYKHSVLITFYRIALLL